MLAPMRRWALLPSLFLAGCTAGGALRAEPLAALEGAAVLAVGLRVQPVDRERAEAELGLDPWPLGVLAVEVQVVNRTFAPLSLPVPEDWALYGGEATERLARGLAPGAAARRLAEGFRAAGGVVAPEEEAALVRALSRRALGPATVPSGKTASGLVYLSAEDGARVAFEGLAGRFLAVAIAAGDGEPRWMAGRLRGR